MMITTTTARIDQLYETNFLQLQIKLFDSITNTDLNNQNQVILFSLLETPDYKLQLSGPQTVQTEINIDFFRRKNVRKDFVTKKKYSLSINKTLIDTNESARSRMQ